MRTNNGFIFEGHEERNESVTGSERQEEKQSPGAVVKDEPGCVTHHLGSHIVIW